MTPLSRPSLRRRSGDVHGNAIVTIRFANCAKARSTHLPRGASITQTSNSGRRSPAAAHFATRSALAQYDPPHRPAIGAFNAGQQLRLAGEAAATVVAHAMQDVEE